MLLSHVAVNKGTGGANSNISPTNGKRKKKAMRKATVEVFSIKLIYLNILDHGGINAETKGKLSETILKH